MGNEIKIKVTAENGTVTTFGKLKEDLKDVETSADKAGTEIHGLGTDLKDTGEHVKGFTQPVVVAGGEMRKFSTHTQQVKSDLKALETGMAMSRQALSQLTSAFAQTDDAAQRVDLKKAISKIKSDLSSAGSAHKIKLTELMDLEPSPADGKKFVTKLADGIEAAGPIIPSVIAAALAASPLIGATISGAVIGGVGIGGVVGGLILASKDPRVKAAFTATATGLKQQLTEASSSFVTPAIAAIGTLGGAVQRINFKAIFADASRYVAPLAAGLGSFLSGVSSGIKDLVHAAGPVISVISTSLSDLGGVLKTAFHDMAAHGEEGAKALRTILTGVNAIIANVFYLINGLTTVYGWIDKIGGTAVFNLLELSMRDATGAAENAGSAVVTLAKKFLGVGDDAKTSANGIQSLAEQLNVTTTAARSLFGASTSAGEAIDAVTAAAKKNGKTLDSSTEKGRANRTAIENLATALEKQTNAYRDVNGEGAKADGVARINRETFIRLATTLTGSARRARELADQLLGIPAKRDVKITANTHDAEGRIKALQDKVNAVHGKTVTLTVRTVMSNGNIHVSGPGGSGTQVKGFASGGIIGAGHAAEGGPRSGLTLVGENGPELADLAPGTTVHSNGDSRRMLGQMGGGGTVTLKFVPSGNRVLDELFNWMLTHLKEVARTQYSSDANLMFGGTR